MRFVNYLLIFNSESPTFLNEIYFPAEASNKYTVLFSKVKATLKKI